MVNGEDDPNLLKSADGMAALEESKSSSSSSSSSSDYSLDDDFIQFDASELRSPNRGNGHIDGSNSEPPRDVGGEAQLASDVHTQGGEMAGPNPFSSQFEVGDNSGESSLPGSKQSPATQGMVRSVGPDPCRIPSTVFERCKSNTPVDWSVASNESLFSITGGNSSFSRDHVFLLDRSGELPNFSSSPHPPMPTALYPDERIPGGGHGLEQPVTAEAANAEAMKDVLRAAADGQVNREETPFKDVHHSASTSRHSDASNQSFAFPILTQGRNVSVKAEPRQQFQAPTQQQFKAEDQKDQKEGPEPPANAAQGGCFSCCGCSSCF